MSFPHGLWRTRGGFILDRAMFVLGGLDALLLTLHPKPHNPRNTGACCWVWEWWPWSIKFRWGHILAGLQWVELITTCLRIKCDVSGQPTRRAVFHLLMPTTSLLSHVFIKFSIMLKLPYSFLQKCRIGQRRGRIRRENVGERRQMEADRMREEKTWTEGAKGNEAESKTESESTAGGEYRAECIQVEPTSFLRLTTDMNHQSAKRTRKDQQK